MTIFFVVFVLTIIIPFAAGVFYLVKSEFPKEKHRKRNADNRRAFVSLKEIQKFKDQNKKTEETIVKGCRPITRKSALELALEARNIDKT